METPRPEPITPAPPRPRIPVRGLLEALSWLRTGVNLYTLTAGNDTAASVKEFTKAAVRLLLDVLSGS